MIDMKNIPERGEMAKKLDMDYLRQKRAFQSMNSEIDGRSVVLDLIPTVADERESFQRDVWPCSLNDYLQKYIGKIAQIEYLTPNGRAAAQKGRITVVGSNFVGIQPLQTGNLFLVDLNSIRSINIINFNKSQRNNRMR